MSDPRIEVIVDVLAADYAREHEPGPNIRRECRPLATLIAQALRYLQPEFSTTEMETLMALADDSRDPITRTAQLKLQAALSAAKGSKQSVSGVVGRDR